MINYGRLDYSELHTRMRHRDKIFYLESIGLLSKYRGKGLGKSLFNKYLIEGINQGCERFILETIEPPMMRLAELQRFRKVRYYPRHFGKEGAWLYEKYRTYRWDMDFYRKVKKCSK